MDNTDGYVYVFSDPANGQIKIGSSDDTQRRLGQIQNERGRGRTRLIGDVKANWRLDAEIAAQNRVMNTLGLIKVPRKKDWFTNPRRATQDEIMEKVAKAVYDNNYQRN